MRRPLAFALVFSVVIVSLGVAPAAGRTIGDLMRDGGRKLSKAEVVTLYTGATVSGDQIGRPETRFQMVYKPDGSAGGSYTNPSANGTVAGKWSVNEQGQFCSDLVNSSGGKIQGCSWLFVQAGRYWAARTDESTEPLAYRTFAK